MALLREGNLLDNGYLEFTIDTTKSVSIVGTKAPVIKRQEDKKPMETREMLLVTIDVA
jgi:hypothetical protein